MKRLAQRIAVLSFAAMGLAACGTLAATDPTFRALKANPPTSLPTWVNKQQTISCRIYNEGRSDAYQLCWIVTGRVAQLYFYNPPTNNAFPPPSSTFITFLRF